MRTKSHKIDDVNKEKRSKWEFWILNYNNWNKKCAIRNWQQVWFGRRNRKINDQLIEIIQSKEQRNRRKMQIASNTSGPMYSTGVLEREEHHNQGKRIFKEIMAKKLPMFD